MKMAKNSEDLRQKIKDLSKEDFIKEFSREFKPRRGGIKESTIFYLWVALCIWKEDKRFSLSEQRDDFHSEDEKNFWDKIRNYLDEHNIREEDCLKFPETRTIKKYFNRPLFKLMVELISTPIEQKALLLKKMRILGMKLLAPFENIKNHLSLKEIDRMEKTWKIIKKFLAILKDEKYIKKTDLPDLPGLMRRLGINKNFYEWLIEEAIDQGYVKRLEKNSSWIMYSGKNLDWLS